MRVLLVQWTFHPNTAGWVAGLEARGHEVTVLVGGGSDVSIGDHHVEVAEFAPRIEALSRALGRGHARILVPRPVRLVRQLRRLAPDLVLVKQQRQSFVNTGPHVLWTSMLAGLFGVPRCSWGNRAEGRDRRERLLTALGLMPRRHFVTKQVAIGACHTPSPPDASPPHIPYAVAAAAQPRPPRDDGPIRVLTVGRLSSARKQVWWTLDAANRAGLLDGSVRFTFAGPGRDASVGLQELHQRIETYGCADLVEIHGPVSHDEIGAVYAEHDLVVVPSRREPFGMVVLEAMAQGVAVVASVDVGARCCIDPGVTGAIYDGTLDGLATTLAELCRDREARPAMGERGRRFVAEYNDPLRVAALLETLGV